jgi:hypothetical protein
MTRVYNTVFAKTNNLVESQKLPSQKQKVADVGKLLGSEPMLMVRNTGEKHQRRKRPRKRSHHTSLSQSRLNQFCIPVVKCRQSSSQVVVTQRNLTPKWLLLVAEETEFSSRHCKCTSWSRGGTRQGALSRPWPSGHFLEPSRLASFVLCRRSQLRRGDCDLICARKTTDARGLFAKNRSDSGDLIPPRPAERSGQCNQGVARGAVLGGREDDAVTYLTRL